MKKTKTLLDQIKAAPRSQHKCTPATDYDTGIAWLKGEITLSQIGRTLWPERKGNSTSYTYTFLIRSIRSAYAQGKIQIVD